MVAQVRTKSTSKHNNSTRVPSRTHGGKLESRKGEVIRRVLEGVPYRQIASEFGAKFDGIAEFVERNKVEIQALKDRAAEQQADLWIMDRRKTTQVLQRLVRRLDDNMNEADPGRDFAALAREQTTAITTAYKINDMLPRSGINLSVDARNQTLNILEGTRLSPDEIKQLLDAPNRDRAEVIEHDNR